MVDAGSFLEPSVGRVLPWLYVDSSIWTAVGLFGNLIFSGRFVYQWLHSERRGRLEVPAAFWHLSFWGSVVALLYALHIDKLPIVLSYAFLPVLHARNLILLRRTREDAAAPHDPSGTKC